MPLMQPYRQCGKRRALIGQQVDPCVDFYESCDVVEWKTKKPILGRVVVYRGLRKGELLLVSYRERQAGYSSLYTCS